jgi:quercetin dioxygenase-like cupin family protein
LSSRPPCRVPPRASEWWGAGRSFPTVAAESADTGGALSLLEAEEPPGFGPPIHIHHDAGEALYVLSGEYLVVVEDETFRCPPGAFVYVPAGVPHGFRVGPAPSRKLNIYVPAAMVGYFDDLAAAAAAGQIPDDQQLTAIAERYSMEVLGPVPEGYL